MIEIQSRDIEIFRILQRYRYLPTRFLWLLLPQKYRGVSYRAFQHRLKKLVQLGYLKIPARRWRIHNAHCKDHVYENGPKAKEELGERGLVSRHKVGYGKQFPHELLVCMTQAGMELTCNNHDHLEYVGWDGICNLKKTPQAVKDSKSPFSIPVYVGGRKRLTQLDGTPAGIRLTTEDGLRPVINIPGFEADRATEDEEPTDIYQKANIEYKLRAVLDMKERRTYRTHYGFKNMYVPFITVSPKRMQNMMAVLERFAPRVNGVPACNFILFKSVPDYQDADTTPDPSDLLLTGQWNRVGYPPFNILNELEAQAERMKKK